MVAETKLWFLEKTGVLTPIAYLLGSLLSYKIIVLSRNSCTMLNNETEILNILRQLPSPALEEVKIFLDFLVGRYEHNSPQKANLIDSLKGKATNRMTTNEILHLTRGEE